MRAVWQGVEIAPHRVRDGSDSGGERTHRNGVPNRERVPCACLLPVRRKNVSGRHHAIRFEKADYDLLSSYTGQYPNSKCFALYYARGSQNISGLWYKPNDEVASSLNAFQNYAIANICTAATGCSLNIFKQLTYPDICVRVEYIPTVTARIHAYKPDAKSGGGFLSDGQAANRLSAKALGEHLRGQLAMLPSASKAARGCSRMQKHSGARQAD